MADSLKLMSVSQTARDAIRGWISGKAPLSLHPPPTALSKLTRPVNFGLGTATKLALRATTVQ